MVHGYFAFDKKCTQYFDTCIFFNLHVCCSCRQKLIEAYCICTNVTWLPSEQFLPRYRSVQLHWYVWSTSKHVAPFRHGFDSHAGMTKISENSRNNWFSFSCLAMITKNYPMCRCNVMLLTRAACRSRITFSADASEATNTIDTRSTIVTPYIIQIVFAIIDICWVLSVRHTNTKKADAENLEAFWVKLYIILHV